MPKYNSIDNIPAKVFFDILKSKDYQQLKPKEDEENLESVFVDIYDDYFLKSNNPESKRYLEINTKIGFLEYKIQSLKQFLYYYYHDNKGFNVESVEAFKKGFGITIDIATDFEIEVNRILTIEVGIIENDLSFLKDEFNDMVKRSQSKEFNYYEQIVSMGSVLKENSLVKANMTLAVYIECEKLAYKIAENYKKK